MFVYFLFNDEFMIFALPMISWLNLIDLFSRVMLIGRF